MASLSFQRLSSALRRSGNLQAITRRSYVTVPTKQAWVPRTASTTPSTVAQTSTGAAVGNPAPVENTASEFKVASEIPPPNAASPAATENNGDAPTDWSKSYHGLSEQAFSKDIAEILLAPIDPLDIEMKPGELNIFIITVYIS